MEILISIAAVIIFIGLLNLIVRGLIRLFHFFDHILQPIFSEIGRVTDKKHTPSYIIPGQEYFDPETGLTWGGDELIPAVYELTIEIALQEARCRTDEGLFYQFAIGDAITVHYRLGRLSDQALINKIEKPTSAA